MNVKDIRDKLMSNGEYPKRDIKDITHIDVHHSASFTKDYKGLDTIKQFAKFHVEGHGWAGIGYHYVVAPDGVIYKTGYANEMRWSVGGNNSYTISVMMIGRFDKEEQGEKQFNEVVRLIRRLMEAYNIPKENVMGHNEYPKQNTICPGIDMDELRGAL